MRITSKVAVRAFGVILFVLSCAGAAMSCSEKRQFRLIHDDDGDSNWDFAHLTVEKIDSAVGRVAGTGVTSFAICTGSDFVHYPSKYSEPSFLKDSGIDERGFDFIRTVLEKTHEKGMESIITYRMNDLHFTDTVEVYDQAKKFQSKWWWDHPEFWTNDRDQGWHTVGAYDFAHKEVRDRKIAVMKEQLERYGDVTDVYLMDFLRFFCYFKTGEGRGHAADMTAMVRRMRELTDSIGRAKGHKILLAARVAPVLDDNLEKGLDVREWLREDLVDFLSLGIHCLLDGNTPVARFRSELGGDLDVPVYACGCDIMYNYSGEEEISDGMIRGWCSSVLDQGADGLQSFNYYFGYYGKKVNVGVMPEKGTMTNRVFYPDMYRELTSLDKLEGRNKIYWLSDGNREYGLTPNTPLPLAVAPGAEAVAPIYVGDKMKKKRPEEVILFYRTDADVPVEVTFNGSPAVREDPSLSALYDRDRQISKGQCQRAAVLPADAIRHGENVIGFRTAPGAAPVKIIRTELALKYGPVDQYGYF